MRVTALILMMLTCIAALMIRFPQELLQIWIMLALAGMVSVTSEWIHRRRYGCFAGILFLLFLALIVAMSMVTSFWVFVGPIGVMLMPHLWDTGGSTNEARAH